MSPLRPSLTTCFLLSFILTGCQSFRVSDLQKLPPTAALPKSSTPGEVQVFYWDGVPGTSTDALTSNTAYPDNPDSTALLNELKGSTNRADNYGSLTRGYISPPSTGLFTFFVSGDDVTEFWLGSNSDPDTKAKIATVPGWTNPLDYNIYSAQRSPAMELQAGERYYFEIVHKEGGGGDHFSVAWEGPGINRQVVSSDSIASYAGESATELTGQGNEESFRLGYAVGYLDGSEGLVFNPAFPPLDNDQDGLYDNWEVVNGLSPTDPSDANSDPDNDLLLAADEFLIGTSENNPDTDGDGIPDGAEFALGLNPVDASDSEEDLDRDGFTNLEEYLAGTDPGNATSVPVIDEEPVSGMTYARGFVGQYFTGTGFERFLTARHDENIQFRSNAGSFAEGQPSDNFSVRWIGEFTAPHSSGDRSYSFRMRTDDGSRLYIDGEQRISAWRDQGATTFTASITLEPQQVVQVLMEYYERGGASVAELSIVDDSTDEALAIGDNVRSPDLTVSSNSDSDADGIPDTWELRNGLLPWSDDASDVKNGSGISNIDAFNSSLSPWTLEPLASPESPTVGDDSATATPPTEPDTSSVTLQWTAPLTRVDGSSISLSEIQSYEILYGSSPDTLSETVTVDGGQTSGKVSGLTPGTWYFSIRVIDTNGLMSENSEVLSHTIQ